MVFIASSTKPCYVALIISYSASTVRSYFNNTVIVSDTKPEGEEIDTVRYNGSPNNTVNEIMNLINDWQPKQEEPKMVEQPKVVEQPAQETKKETEETKTLYVWKLGYSMKIVNVPMEANIEIEGFKSGENNPKVKSLGQTPYKLNVAEEIVKVFENNNVGAKKEDNKVAEVVESVKQHKEKEQVITKNIEEQLDEAEVEVATEDGDFEKAFQVIEEGLNRYKGKISQLEKEIEILNMKITEYKDKMELYKNRIKGII